MQERGSLLRTARLRKGWSQQELADWSRTSVSSVQRAERGEPLRVDICQRLCKALGKEKPEELGLRCYGESEESQSEVGEPGLASASFPTGKIADDTFNTRINTQNATVVIVVQGDNISTIQLPTTQEVVAINATAYDQGSSSMVDHNKRNTLKLGAAAASAYFLAPQAVFNSDVLSRLERVLNKPSSIDTTTLDVLEMFTQNSWQLIPDVAGTVSYHSLHFVSEHLQEATALLEESHPESIYKQLCSYVSELALALGIMLRAMQDHAGARRHYKISVDAAREAGNPVLQAVGLARMTLALMDKGQLHTARSLIQEANSLAAQNGTPITLAWLAAIEAEVHARMRGSEGVAGDKASQSALERAEGVTGVTATSESDPYRTTFNQHLLAGYKSVCYMQLNNLDAARDVLQEALSHPNFPSLYLRSSMLTDLASIYIRQGEVEEGCKLATQALTITTHTKIPTMQEYLRGFRSQLEPWKDTQAVKAFDERIPLAWRKDAIS